MRILLSECLLALALVASSHAQTPLFLEVQPSLPGGSLPPTVNAYYDVEIDFDALKHAPEELEIALPDGETLIAGQTQFLYRTGYLSREEWDPPGTPPIYPHPDLPNDQFSYRWVGGNSQYDVALTVIEGRMTGLITGTKRYGIQRLASGDYRMADIRLAGFAGCAIGEEQRRGWLDSPRSEPLVTVSMVREVIHRPLNQSQRGTSHVRTDLLVPWTEQARIDAGGAPSNPNDTTALYDLIQTAVDNAQTAFHNSLTNVLVTRYVTARVTGFALTGDPVGDLDELRQNATVLALRNQTGTDLVVALVQNSGTAFPACGIANVQTYPGCFSASPGCGLGTSFEAYAYSLVAADCAIWDDSFTHEIGHLMGGNHTRGQLAPADVSAIVGNGFPDPFAKLVPGIFASIMSTNFDTPRRLYFSNPNVVVNGVTTGNLGTENNARIVDLLTPVMEDYRDRPEVIFANGFQ
jgi:hypothetical protein